MLMKNLLFFFFCFIGLSITAQDAVLYDDLIIESDSTTKTFKPTGRNYIILKSKRGADGMPKTSSGDSIKSMNITDIVLVFSETEAGAIAGRPIANRERWENLIKTYPEFFKENPNLPDNKLQLRLAWGRIRRRKVFEIILLIAVF